MNHDPVTEATGWRRLRAGLTEQDALLLLDAKNIRYLTGFTGSEGALLAGPDWMTLLVDGRYVTQALGEAKGAEVFEFRNRVEGIASVVEKRSVLTLGFESPALTVAEYLRLQEKLTGVTLRPLAEELHDLRSVKSGDEIKWIRAAARIAGEALAEVRTLIRPGVREREIAVELDYRIRQKAEQVSFETIVAAGPNTALPHATPGERRIADGDNVMVDYGAVFAGYHSDETCTWFVGRAEPRQKEVYERVREAHDRAIAAIRAGIACGEIDRIARAALAEAGLDGHFTHGTGHGVGLDVHEAPRLASGRQEILQAGMVVTIEPGVYLPGHWGIRIEDLVLVTETGSEILTPTAKGLTIL